MYIIYHVTQFPVPVLPAPLLPLPPCHVASQHSRRLALLAVSLADLLDGLPALCKNVSLFHNVLLSYLLGFTGDLRFFRFSFYFWLYRHFMGLCRHKWTIFRLQFEVIGHSFSELSQFLFALLHQNLYI